MAKTSKKALGAAMAGVMAIGAVAGTVGAVQEVRAGVAEDVQLIHAKIEHFRKSLKTNYLGLKNVGQWQAYEKEIRTLIAKLPDGSSKDKYTDRVNVCTSLLNAAAKVNHVEKSLVDNYHGIKNAETWNVYLNDGQDLLGKVDREFTAQREELTARLAEAKSTVDGIIEKHKVDLAAATKLYDEAVASKDLAKAEAALKAAEALGTHATSDELEAKCKALIAELSATLEIASVNVPNAGELVIKFNKAVDEKVLMNSTNTAVNASIITDMAGAWTDEKAELSKDGKTLTLYGTFANNTGLSTHILEIANDAIVTKDGQKLAAYKEVIKAEKDLTRATIVGAENKGLNKIAVTFSEPVAAGSFTVTNAKGETIATSGTTATNFDKTVEFTLTAGATLPANEKVNVLFAGITDKANNISVPTSVSVTTSAKDEVAPTVVSVTATSPTSAKVVFSEAMSTVGTATVTGGTSVTAAVDAKNPTEATISWTGAVANSAVVTIAKTGTTDLAGNDMKDGFSQVVNFNVDKTAPAVQSVKPVYDASNKKTVLEVTLSEDVTAAGAKPAVTYVDKYGMTKTIDAGAIGTPKFKEVDGAQVKNVILVELTRGDKTDDTELLNNVEYTAKFAKDAYTDGFGNKSVETKSKFVLSPISAEDVKLATTGITTNVDKEGRYIQVVFNKAVDVASATNVANYIVEGSEVTKVAITNNSASGATVKAYLKAGTVEVTGNYNVTVQGVKGFDANVTTMDTKTVNMAIKENIAATVKSSAITAMDNSGKTTTLKVTFSEGVVDTDANGDYDLYIDGKKVDGVAVTNAVASDVITFTIAKDLAADIANGKAIKLVATDSFDIADAAGNYANASEIVVK